MVTYVAVGWAIRSFYFNEIDREMGTQVQEGKLAMNLIRPVDFQTVMIADAAGQSAFRAVLFTVPIAIVLALIFPVKPPASLAAALLFLWSAVMAFFLVAAINFLVGLIAIRSKSILGILRAKYLLLELAVGPAHPDDALPRAAAHAAPGVAVSAHQLHPRGALPGQGDRRRGRATPGPAGGLDDPAAVARAVGVEEIADADHDSGRMRTILDFGFWILDCREPT